MTQELKNKKIKVTKSFFWQSPRVGCRVDAEIMGYASVDGLTLLGTVNEYEFDKVEQQFGWTSVRLIRSDDNGHTWNDVMHLDLMLQTDLGVLFETIPHMLLDTHHDVCVLFYMRRWKKSTQTVRVDFKKFKQTVHRISRDGGQSWEDARQVIQKGPEYDETHYLRGLLFGRNGGAIHNRPIQLRSGQILAPMSVYPWVEATGKYTTAQQSALLIGTWDDQGREFEWDLGDYIKGIEPGDTADELTVAELRDGSILGIMRSQPKDAPGKIYCVSQDGGRTWSPSQRLTYDTGEMLFSPSSISRLIRSSRNGNLYWIANILPFREDKYTQTPSNRQRFILQIAEVDEQSCTIKHDTVTTIDESQDENDPREYSNFEIYEDRGTGYFILTMCEASGLPMKLFGAPPGYQGSYATKESFTSHSYKYEIAL